MNNLEKIKKINAHQKRVRELFEMKYTREDWDNKTRSVKAYFEKCKEQAATEIFGA